MTGGQCLIMKLLMEHDFDVLVVGSGIAGLSAAVQAAEYGCRTAIISGTHLFSGSSFYPGTWGFGLVGPSDENDGEDMISTIQEVGCGVTDNTLVSVFVKHINTSIERLEGMGCHPRKAAKRSEREYIPCFDHKHRSWNGLEGNELRRVFGEQLSKHQITVWDSCVLLELVKENDRICGAVFAASDKLIYIGCRALVLATGGYGSLFENHLCTDDVCGLGQALALKAGCRLVNMEFMQMMPGYLSPARNTIFNEKTFRFAKFSVPGQETFFDPEEEMLLDLRSTYGPFTSRLPSSRIDRKLYLASREHPGGVRVSYADATKNDPPEFVKLYFDWLKQNRNVTVDDTIQIGIFSHAANGGIHINTDGWTGIEGLFACGEVTGGMHGADRIGGLSTANGLVFGQRAGKAAAAYADRHAEIHPADACRFSCWSIPDRAAIRDRLQKQMYQNAMIIRTESGLAETLAKLSDILANAPRTPDTHISSVVDSRILEGQLMTSVAFLKAALMRRESRGSHFRDDYPAPDSAMARPIGITLEREITARFFDFPSA